MKKMFFILFLLLVSSLSLKGQTQPTDTDADGYYNVSTLDHLRWVSENDSSWTWNFELDNYINAADTRNWNFGDHDNNPNTPDSAMGWNPIGNSSKYFSGKFDGNGYSIDSLYINRPLQNFVGFFGYINGMNDFKQLRNLNVLNAEIIGNNYVGIIAGGNGAGTYRCRTTGTVKGISYVGGFSGYSFYKNNNCISNSIVNGNSKVGGFTGQNYHSLGLISNCYSKTSVEATGQRIGGFVGENLNSSKILNCYSTGSVSANNNFVGGFLGYYSSGSIDSCFWDTETSGKTTSAGGTGKATAQMKTQSTFTVAGWDFDSIWSISSQVNNGYPYLQGFEEENICSEEPTDTDGDGYRNISSLCHLRWVSENDSSWTWNFEFDNDINAADTRNWNVGDHDNNPNTPDSAMGWSPIGYDNYRFKGIIYGNGYKIDSLYINRPQQDGIGFIGFSYLNGEIKNIGISNFKIVGKDKVGGIVGYNYYGYSLNNCDIDGEVRGNNYVGGLVGFNDHTSLINNCNSNGSVKGNDYVGGLVGYSYYQSKIENCYSTSIVNGSNKIGGLVGYNYEASNIINCYSTSTVNGVSEVGGLVGRHSYYSKISNCYSNGSVNGSNETGGLIGELGSYTEVNYSFWDTETSGKTTSAGGTGKTTAQMKSQSTFTNWDFVTTWSISSIVNDGYPYLRGFEDEEEICSEEPTDTDGDGYRNISTLCHLRWVSENDSSWTWNFELDNDINAADTRNWNDGDHDNNPNTPDSAMGWSPIGKLGKKFKGIFDGKGFKIDSIFIKRPGFDYIGFFGLTNDSNTKILNLGLINLYVEGKTYTGGLIGSNNGKVLNSNTNGEIHGLDNDLGGLIGFNDGIVENSYSRANIYGYFTSNRGGLFGVNWSGTVKNSYSSGYLNGTGSYLGGLGGRNFGTVTNSFWDIETSGKTTSAGGTGKTTAQMITKSTFTDAGWDFDTTWSISSQVNNGYPHLRVFGSRESDTIMIGKQVWMKRNLDVACYRNGDTIPQIQNPIDWINTKSGAWCYYNNDAENGKIYGRLYNWYAVNDPRGLAPEGWRIPSDDDWKELEIELGMTKELADSYSFRGSPVGAKIAGGFDLWADGELRNNTSFNSSGFTGLPSGYRYYWNGSFDVMGYYTFWWTSSPALYRGLNNSVTSISRNSSNETFGFPVRCVKDYVETNLIKNPSCELPLVNGKIPYWNEVIGNNWTQRSDNPYHGKYFFYSGVGLYSELEQYVDLSKYSNEIDNMTIAFKFSAMVRSYRQNPADMAKIVLEFWNADKSSKLDSFDFGYYQELNWKKLEKAFNLPVNSRWINIRLISKRLNGTNNDGYFDDLYLMVTDPIIQLATPTLVSPSDEADNQGLSLILEWSNVSGATSYDIQLSTDNTFAITIINATTSNNQYAGSGLSNSTQYFWRARAKNSEQTGSWSTVFNFTTSVAPPAVPTLTSPSNNVTDISTTVTLNWSAVIGATSYNVQVSSDINFTTLKVDVSGLSSPTYSNSGLDRSTKYYWRAKAINAGGESDWSSVWNFTTIASEAVPSSWDYTDFTGNNSTIVLQKAINPKIDDRDFMKGDAVGVFFTRDGNLVCAGYQVWNNANMAITVWGDDTETIIKDGFATSENYLIKVWDGQLGRELNAEYTYSSGNPYYTVNGFSIFGAFKGVSSVTHSLYIKSGWNLISSYVLPPNDSLEVIFNLLKNKLTILKNNAGQVYIPSFDINSIGKWSYKQAYQAYMSSADTLKITGNQLKPETEKIVINSGWNLVAYLRNSAKDVAECLTTLTEDNSLTIAKNNAGQVYIPSFDINSIGNMLPGQGYQMYLSKKDSLIYPANSLSRAGSGNLTPMPKELIPGFKETGNSSVAIFQINAPNGDEIGVYNQNDELIGSGVVHNGYAAVTIWGDNDQTEETDGAKDNDELRIKNYELKTGRLNEVSIIGLEDFTNGEKLSGLNYKKDAVYFAKATVEKNESNISLNVRPNPASEIIEIELETPDCKATELKIYSTNGKLISDLSNKLSDLSGKTISQNISSLTQGEYTIILTCSSQRAMRNVVVVR